MIINVCKHVQLASHLTSNVAVYACTELPIK